MDKYKARDAAVPGSSVSGTHHGWWSDQIRHEERIRLKWFKEYGHLYVKELVDLRNDDRSNPIDGHLPPVQPYKYLNDETVPESQPVAYLRACLHQKEIQDVAIRKGGLGHKMNLDTSGVSSSQKNVGGNVHPAALCFDKYKSTNVPMQLVHDSVTTRTPSKNMTGVKDGWVSDSQRIGVFDRGLKHGQATSSNGTVKNTKMSVFDVTSEFDWFPLTPDGRADLDKMAWRVGGCSWSEMQHRLRQMYPPEESTDYRGLARACSQVRAVKPNVACAKVLCPHNIYTGSFHDGNVPCKAHQVSSRCRPGALPYSRLPSRNVSTRSPPNIFALCGRTSKSSDLKEVSLPFCPSYPFPQERHFRMQNEKLVKRGTN